MKVEAWKNDTTMGHKLSTYIFHMEIFPPSDVEIPFTQEHIKEKDSQAS